MRKEPLPLHSGVFTGAQSWDPLLPELAGYRAIAFDPPGIGRSPAPAYPLTMRALASVGAGLLDELGIGSAHVLGLSFGGAVAQQMALSHPSRVRRLILASTVFGSPGIPGNAQALWHFLQSGRYSQERLEQTAGTMFGGPRYFSCSRTVRKYTDDISRMKSALAAVSALIHSICVAAAARSCSPIIRSRTFS
jgi:pimeloyl-ACP methyl ester carboxylesterase